MQKKTDFDKIERAVRVRGALSNAVLYILLTLWALMVLFPFYWMLLTSVKPYSAYNSEYIPQLYTLAPTLQNYLDAFTAVPLARYLLNTLIFTVVTTGVMLLVTVLAAFGFARLSFRGRDLMFTLFLALMMIPSELVVITNYVTITNWGLRNSFAGLILPSVTSVFYIYLLRENFAQVPDELYYAAKVDGTSDFKYLWKVMLPINGIQSIRENGFGRENIPAMMAAVVVISVPLIALFLIFRNKIMEGVSRGGTKG